jgi:uncharacterized protein YndB with AHSA1/START domain
VRSEASRELLAPRDEVWSFLAEPYHLSDWWPGTSAVRPDRRGLAEGARWEVEGSTFTPLLGTRGSKSLLLVRRVEPPSLAAWYLTSPQLEVEVSLEQSAPDRTLATVIVTGPWRPEILGPRRRLAHSAVDRLYALVQTAASL